MPGAIIAFDQSRPGPSTSYGSPGVARNDLWLSWLITCRCTTSGNTSFAWEFLDVPPGSASTLSGAATVNATFTPDLPGSYRVQLTTNGGGPGNVQILIAAVRYDDTGALVLRGWCLPALGEVPPEDNFGGQTRGWAAAMEFIFADLRSALAGVGGLRATQTASGPVTADADAMVFVDLTGGTVPVTPPGLAAGVTWGVKDWKGAASSTHTITIANASGVIEDPNNPGVYNTNPIVIETPSMSAVWWSPDGVTYTLIG